MIKDELGDGSVRIMWETSSERVQLMVMLEALVVYAERNTQYRDNWARMGWRGMLVRVRERAERLWDGFWNAPDKRTESVDDALDLINYAVFLIRALRSGNRDGNWW